MNCEIEFLLVGDGSKAGDAIVVRYGSDQAFELMVIDGGTAESGSQVVNHINAHLVGPHADEVINLFALAIRHDLTADWVHRSAARELVPQRCIFRLQLCRRLE